MHPKPQKITFSKIKIRPTSKRKSTPRKKVKEQDIVASPKVKSPKKGQIRIVKSKLDSKITSGYNGEYKYLSEWAGLMRGHPAFLLGNAPSISTKNLTLLDPYFTIGMNRIYYIYDPTVIIWQDRQIWDEGKESLTNNLSIKVATSSSDPRHLFLNYRRLSGPYKFTMDPSILCGMGNTGVLAAQLAVAMGCNSLILLGMDCEYEEGGRTDFYGINKDHRGYTLGMCMRAAKWLKENSQVPVYNCSNNKLWPKLELEDVIATLNPPQKDRNFYLSLLKK